MSTALIELRRYVLHPGRREELVALFGRELVHTQEAAGLQVLAQFRDVDEPDHFVWLRGFPTADAQARADALAAFYGGPAWAAHAGTANATMCAWDDVLLLRPLRPGPFGGPLTTCLLERPLSPAEEAALPGTALVTAGTENLFPALPVREEHAAVWFGGAPVPEVLRPLLAAPPHVARLALIGAGRSSGSAS